MWSYQDGFGWFLAMGMLAMVLTHAPNGALRRLPAIDWRLTIQQIEEAFERGPPCGEDPSICVELDDSVR